MWISRATFDALNTERLTATAEARTLAAQNDKLTITMDWMRMRLEQVERERAHLLKTYMGVAATVPEFVKPEPSQEDVIGGANVFNDIGDDQAKALGVGWNGDGSVTKQ